MRRSGLRYTLLFILLVFGIAAAFFTWDTYHRHDAALRAQRDVDVRLDSLFEAAGDLRAAQQAAIVPGQADSSTDKTAALFQRLHDETAAIRRGVQTVEGMTSMQSIAMALDALVDTDARTREYVRLGQDLMAADLMLSEGRERLDGLVAGLRTVRTAERGHGAKRSAEFVQRAAAVVGGTAGAWLLGMLLLVWLPKPPRADGATLSLSISDAAKQMEAPPPERRSSIDLEDAAAVCTQLARLTDAADLPSALAHAAAALDAIGVIVWMGAGEELFATATHGYDRRVLSRLGPIGRSAANATAAAWRDAAVRTVAASGSSSGAVVAPIVGPSGCVGVLSVELRSGRAIDAATTAVAAMVAAQLGGVLQAWPAHSASAPASHPHTSATA